MSVQQKENRVVAFGWSLAVTSVLSSILVVAKEKNDALMATLKAATGHHWVTHGIVVLAVFIVVGVIMSSALSRRRTDDGVYNRVAIATAISTIISGLVLATFFLFAG